MAGASWERSGSNGMWMLSAPVGEYGMFVMQRGTPWGAEFLVFVGWGCRGVTGDQLMISPSEGLCMSRDVVVGHWISGGVGVMDCRATEMLSLSFSRSSQKVRLEGRGRGVFFWQQG